MINIMGMSCLYLLKFLFRVLFVLSTILQCSVLSYDHNSSDTLSRKELKLNANEDFLNITGLILARGGSKGIPKKNLAIFKRKTLLRRAIMTMKEFGGFSSIWVSTDSEDIAEEAESSGAYVHYRSKETATDTASSLMAVQEFRERKPELPRPDLGDISELQVFMQQFSRTSNPTLLGLTYSDICDLDVIEVEIIPEKKGLFLKHVEYQVMSKRLKSSVRRRYNDFLALFELILGRFPYRLIPKLPPKKMVGAIVAADSHFIEERRKSLRRWLTIVARHPVIMHDPMVDFFLTFSGPDVQNKIREVFRRAPDEFTTSELAAKAKELVPPDTHTEFANSRDQIRLIFSGVSRLKHIADLMAIRSHGYADNMADFGAQLTSLANDPHGSSKWATGGNTVWADMKKGFHAISKEFALLSSKALQRAVREEDEVCERLNLLLEVLGAHRDLCERHEKGVVHDHQRALAKMLALKKRQIQGVIKGADAESVEQMERKMMEQESVIANVDLRNAYALHCLHLETQLVHAHLEILASILNTLVSVQIQGHSELADVWRLIQPSIMKCLPEKKSHLNGNVSSSSLPR